jgi:integrase
MISMATPEIIPQVIWFPAPQAVQQITHLPARVAKPRQVKRSGAIFLSPQEMLAVLRAAKKKSVRDWAMILLAYRHGLRASEVCGLRFADVNLKDGAISIERLKGSLRTVQPLYAHRGQPLLDEVAAVRAWLRSRAADGSDHLSTSRKGGRLDRTQFFRTFQAVAEAAGIPAEKRHPHVLKHSLASHLIAGNVNLALVKQALGHRSISSTMVYVGTTDAQAAKAVQAALMGVFSANFSEPRFWITSGLPTICPEPRFPSAFLVQTWRPRRQS